MAVTLPGIGLVYELVKYCHAKSGKSSLIGFGMMRPPL
jgi:hypothetical protein